MRPSGFARFVVVPCVFAFAALAGATVALAASVLGGVRVDATPAGGAIVSLSFNGGVPVYHLVGAGTPETAVLFDGTSLGTVAPAVAGAGPVTSVSVAQSGSGSSVALHLTSATRVQVRTSGNSVFIDVAPAAAAANVLGGFNAPAAPALAGGLGPVTVLVALKYADVSEIAGILSASANVASNDTFSPLQTNIGTSSLTGSIGGIQNGFNASAQPQSFGNNGNFGQQVGLAQRVNDNIAIDRRLNAIVLSGTPDVVAGLRAIIEKIDIPVRSVILETQIVELSDSAARNIGLDFSPSGSGVVVNGSAVPFTIKNLSPSAGELQIAANLSAQITLGNAKIIAKPRILAQSGQPASILTGDAIPILTSVVVGGGGTGGGVTSQQVNYVNVGVNLQIQPRVSSDGFVTSHIYSEVSSVTQFIQGVPQISQRTATTTATVRDGESFVIGGLLQDNEIRNLTKLPFIGDIPLIGVFFRHVNTSHTQTNLYIVVTPHVVAESVPPNAPPPALLPQTLPSALPQVAPPAAPAPATPAHATPRKIPGR